MAIVCVWLCLGNCALRKSANAEDASPQSSYLPRWSSFVGQCPSFTGSVVVPQSARVVTNSQPANANDEDIIWVQLCAHIIWLRLNCIEPKSAWISSQGTVVAMGRRHRSVASRPIDAMMMAYDGTDREQIGETSEEDKNCMRNMEHGTPTTKQMEAPLWC